MNSKEEILSKRVVGKTGGNRSTVFGVGINDAWFRTQWKEDGKVINDVSYNTWGGILRRSYSDRLHTKRPTYIGCSVCEEWLTFSNYDEWFLENYIVGYHLDKDILFPDNKVYSPETCIFIPLWLNSFTTANNSSRGDCPIGVSFHKRIKKFAALCQNPTTKKQEHLGYFMSAECAYSSWLKRKLEHVENMKEELDAIDLRLYEAVKAKILSLK